MSKTAIDAPRGNVFLLEPEKLVLVTETDHPLYDPRVHDDPEESLIRNIMVYGVIEPVIVRVNGDAVEVVAGRQRVKASIEANKRLYAEGKEKIRIPCIVRRGQEADLFGVTVSENEQRRDDNPLAKADKAQRLLNMGKTEEDVAIAFGVSTQTIKNWLKLQELSAPVRNAVERGEISATAAGELAGLSGEEQKARMEEMKAAGGKMTVTRAKKAAKGEKSAQGVRMKSRKEIEEELKTPFDERDDYQKGYSHALKWVIGEAK